MEGLGDLLQLGVATCWHTVTHSGARGIDEQISVLLRIKMLTAPYVDPID